ncbi:MAG: 50S ribosomal protein L24 [Bacteroidia bacterium]
MSIKLKIKKGDLVKVISGEAKGETGKVISINRENNRVLVEGVNKVKKHTKPNAKHPNGGIVEQEATLHISNLMLMDGAGKTSRIGRKLDEKSNKLVRFYKSTGEVVK